MAIGIVVGGCVGTLRSEGASNDGDAGTSRRDAGAIGGDDAGPIGGDDSGPGPGDAGSGRRDAGPTRTDAGVSEACAGGPLDLPIPGCEPTPVPDTGDPYEDCVTRINQFRRECQCLGPLTRWTEAESCADMHAEYDSTRPPHSGFRDGICPLGGRGQNECPGWPSIGSTISGCLQSMWDEGPGEPFSEHGHYINMTNPAHTQVACGFYTTPGGSVWAVQNFR
jgi:hypothetical protein